MYRKLGGNRRGWGISGKLYVAISAFLIIPFNLEAGNYHFKKRVNVRKLYVELKSSGFLVRNVYCTGEDDCVVDLDKNETKSPKSIIKEHVFTNIVPKEPPEKGKQAIRISRMKILLESAENGRINESEKSEFLILLIKYVLNL